MSKQKALSSKVVRAKMLAIYELEQFIEYIRTIDPELKLDEALVLAAFVLSKLPTLFEENPDIVNDLKKVAGNMKHEHSRPVR